MAAAMVAVVAGEAGEADEAGTVEKSGTGGGRGASLAGTVGGFPKAVADTKIIR